MYPEEENSGFVDPIISLCSFDNMSKLEVNNPQESVHGMSNKSFFRNSPEFGIIQIGDHLSGRKPLAYVCLIWIW